MADLKLASAGDDIKLWSGGDCHSLVKQFNPHNQNISSICWSHDNNLLASISSHDDKISVTTVRNSVVKLADFNCGTGKLCLDFIESSRYLLCGGLDGIVSIWDLKSQKIKRNYKNHKGPVTCARFNWNGSFMATGSETGEVILYNVVTGQGSSPLVTKKAQAVRQLQYSMVKKSLLGVVSDEGAVNMWDCNTRQLIHAFTDTHRAPATGISFSPINDIFLMSVGLDKRIICFDLQNKKPVKIISAESPLTSIDTMADGATVAVGSTRGKVYMYDLRMGNSPVHVMDAHKSSVQCLRFQSDLNTESSDGKVAVSSAQMVKPHRLLPSAPATSAAKQMGSPRDVIGASHVQERPVISDGGYEDIFSPVREGNQDQSSEGRLAPGRNSSTALSVAGNSTDEGYAGGVFSPLSSENALGRRENTLGVSPLALSHTSPTQPTVTQEQWTHDSYTNIGYDRIQNGHSGPIYDGHKGSEGQPLNGALESSPVILPTPTSNTPQGMARQVPNISVPGTPAVSQSNQPLAVKSVNFSPEKNEYHKLSPQRQGVSASPSLPVMSSLEDSPGGVAGAGAMGVAKPVNQPSTPEGVNAQSVVLGEDGLSHSGDNNKPQLGSFQTQFVRNLIREELEEFTDQIQDQIRNLQVEMLKQFYQQQCEIKSLLQHYSVNEELLAENERLREENKRLKNKF